MRPVEKHERRQCPAEFQDRLTRIGGKNQFGTPNFRISWGQSEFLRMGNIWRDRFGNERRAYRDIYQCHGMPCWVIMRWKQPTHYGSPETYYQNTWDEFSKMHFLGEYPWRGRYEIVQPLMWQEMTEGKIVTEWIPSINPHTGIIETIPMRKKVGQKLIVHHMELSHILDRQNYSSDYESTGTLARRTESDSASQQTRATQTGSARSGRRDVRKHAYVLRASFVLAAGRAHIAARPPDGNHRESLEAATGRKETLRQRISNR